MLEMQTAPDEKDEENQAYRAQNLQRTDGTLGEYPRRNLGSESAEERGPKQNPSGYFADNPWLTCLARDPTAKQGSHQHNSDLSEQQAGYLILISLFSSTE